MADNWEYHQDERDRAFGCIVLLVLGTLGVCLVGVVVSVILMCIWMP